jgi:hypothetical protein
MAYSPIAFTAANYRDYKFNWLKAYEPGTTTPKAMGTDSTLSAFISKAQVNIDGFFVSAGGTLITPYVDGTYDLWLFPTEAEAEANDTSSALRLADAVTGAADLAEAISLAPVSEVITLIDGQTVVTFPTQTTGGAEFHINGIGVDSRMLTSLDYNEGLTTASTITLFDSYPAGSVVTLSKNTSSGASSVARDFVHNEATLDAAIAATNIVAGDSINVVEREATFGGGAMWDVVLSTTVTENLYDIVQCTGVPTLSLVLRAGDIISFRAFGGVTGGGVSTVNSATFERCLAVASERSIAAANTSSQSEYPAQEISFDSDTYYFDRTVIVPSTLRGLTISAKGRAIFAGEDITGFITSHTGDIFNLTYENIAFQSSATGCVKIDANDKSGSLVLFKGCRFMEHPTRAEVGVDYTNKSSQLKFDHCFFHRVRTLGHFKNQDLITLEDCWAEPGVLSTYASKDGYIRCDKGFLRINNSEFSAGPSNGLGGATEVAFINMGIEGAAAPTVDNAHLVISKTRIGFENGSGALVNWFVPVPSNVGTGFRAGIIIDNSEVSPREDKVTAIDGALAAPMLRLFTMPSVISVQDTINTQDRTQVIVAGSTTTLATLRASLNEIVITQPIEDKEAINSARYYNIDGCVCPRAFLAATTDSMEYAQWMQLFDLFDYWFDSDTVSSATSVDIDTFFAPPTTPDNDIETALFEVSSGGRVLSVAGGSGQSLIPLYGIVTMHYESATGLISASFNDLVNYGALPQQWAVTAVFLDGATERTSVTTAQAATSILRIKVANQLATNIRLRGANIKPKFTYDRKSKAFNRGISTK